ncbi:hypothetical protein K402DRAFT_342639 [Aulographum hederae CBS 113979]|uniref:Calcofluor white hypersensitive protein n=1 Tax=Aulographum hederae CBS 113979 TaxID=1176131 RepID=A0A6G1GKT6_9PEZI|nr:hypothetical protein K402DRAFT_342639 [Aulographum hederae CBS 113979]
MSGRILKVGAGVAAAGAGYYLYSAGGSPRVAEKQMEHDASRFSTSIKDQLPGREKEVKTSAKVYAEQAGQKVDDAIAQAKAKTQEVDATAARYQKDAGKILEQYKKETGKDVTAAIDKFDKTVEEGAAKSKSWAGSWFGGK